MSDPGYSDQSMAPQHWPIGYPPFRLKLPSPSFFSRFKLIPGSAYRRYLLVTHQSSSLTHWQSLAQARRMVAMSNDSGHACSAILGLPWSNNALAIHNDERCTGASLDEIKNGSRHGRPSTKHNKGALRPFFIVNIRSQDRHHYGG